MSVPFELFCPVGGESIKKDSGHLIFFSEEYKNAYVELSGLFGDIKNYVAIADLIDNISVIPKKRDGVNYVSLKELEKSLALKKSVLNKRLNKMVELGLGTFVPVDHRCCDDLHPKVKCFLLSDRKSILTFIKKDRDVKKARSLSRQAMAKSTLTTSTLKELNLPETAIMNSDGLQYGLSMKGVSQIEEVFAPKGNRTSFYSTGYKDGKKDVLVSTESRSHVFTVEDLQTFCALVTLTIRQWDACSDYYLSNNEYPENVLYVELSQIMKLLTKSINQRLYEDTRASMGRLIETVVKSYSGESLFQGFFGGYSVVPNELTANVQHTFQLFEPNKVEAYSKEKAQLRYDADMKASGVDFKAHAYKLVWNNAIFQKMLTDDFFFNVPLSILSAKTHVFLLYMMLRSSFHGKSKYKSAADDKNVLVYTISELHTKIAKESDFKNFKKSLMRELVLFDVDYVSNGADDLRVFQLEGIEVRVAHDQGKIEAVTCVVDQSKMLKACGIDSDHKGYVKGKRVKAAPQSKNPVMVFEEVYRNKAELGDDFSVSLIQRLVVNRNNVHFSVNENSLVVSVRDLRHKKRFTHYSSSNEVKEFAGLITEDELGSVVIYKLLIDWIPKLPMIESGHQTLSVDLFQDIFSSLSKRVTMPFDREMLFNVLSSSSVIAFVLANWTVNEQRKDDVLSLLVSHL